MRRVSRRRENLLSKQRLLPLALAALVAVVLTTVGFVASGTAATQASFKAGLVSDVGRFNDKGFNQNQLTGLKKAARDLKIQYRAVESRSAGDYLPNMASLARSGFNIVISAGFLLADATKEVAGQFPNTKFAITDYDVKGPPFNAQSPNVEGLTYATQQNSYLIGCLAVHVAQRAGKKNIRDVGIFLAVKGAKTGKGFKGGSNLVFNLQNKGVALGKFSPRAHLKKAWLTQIAKLKAQIISGKLKPPTSVSPGA